MWSKEVFKTWPTTFPSNDVESTFPSPVITRSVDLIHSSRCVKLDISSIPGFIYILLTKILKPATMPPEAPLPLIWSTFDYMLSGLASSFICNSRNKFSNWGIWFSVAPFCQAKVWTHPFGPWSKLFTSHAISSYSIFLRIEFLSTWKDFGIPYIIIWFGVKGLYWSPI